MELTNNSTPLKKPKLLRGVPTKSDKFIFIDNTTNEPIDAGSISLLIVDDNTLNAQNKEKEQTEREQAKKDAKAKGGKYSYFTHRESANYLGLKNAIKRVFNNFKFTDNRFKEQLRELNRVQEEKQQEEKEVFELPHKYSQEQAEKDGATVPLDYDEVIDVSAPKVAQKIEDVINEVEAEAQVVESQGSGGVSLHEIENVFGVKAQPQPQPQPQVNYSNVTSKYSDTPEVEVGNDLIETNLNISKEEAQAKAIAHEESQKTVINDDTNPIPDVHLDLEKLDKDLVIFDKPKSEEVLGKVETETVEMPEGLSTPFAPKDNSVFTPEFNDEYLEGSEEFQKLHKEERRSVSIMNTETGEKQVLVDLSKEGGDPNAPAVEGENLENMQAEEGASVVDLEKEKAQTGAYQQEIVKGKKTYKLKKYKQDIIPEDIKSGRGIAWMAYILFFIPLLFKRYNTFVRHHANEGLELNLMEILAAGMIVPYVLLQQGMFVVETEIAYLLTALAFGGVALALVLVIAFVFSVLFSLFGLTSNLPFFWGFRFIKVAKHKK